MSQAWLKPAILAVVAVMALTGSGARADDSAAWLKDRQERFAAYRTAHPDPDAEIAAIKAKTAAWKASDKPVDCGTARTCRK